MLGIHLDKTGIIVSSMLVRVARHGWYLVGSLPWAPSLGH